MLDRLWQGAMGLSEQATKMATTPMSKAHGYVGEMLTLSGLLFCLGFPFMHLEPSSPLDAAGAAAWAVCMLSPSTPGRKEMVVAAFQTNTAGM